jgi:hypothetical protein
MNRNITEKKYSIDLVFLAEKQMVKNKDEGNASSALATHVRACYSRNLPSLILLILGIRF